MRHYKDIIDAKAFKDLYSLDLNNFSLYNCKPKDFKQIPVICDNCGDIFILHISVFKKRLGYTDYYTRNNCIHYCQSTCCTKAKKQKAAVKSFHSITAYCKKKDYWSTTRKGKTLEEIYGIEKADEIRTKMKEKRSKQDEPMLGKTHSVKSKMLMSLAKQSFLNDDERMSQAVYNSKVTSTKICFKQYLKECQILSFNINRSARIDSIIKAQLKSFRSRKNVKHSRWFDNKPILCQSSYEYAYINYLNVNKIYFDRCDKVLFYNYKDKIHGYNPDFNIYEDKACTKLKTIVEVKPYWCIHGSSDYSSLTKIKLSVLKDFCTKNSYNMLIITEKDINLKDNNNYWRLSNEHKINKKT